MALSGVSRRANASHSSTESGMTSTARESRVLASAADASRLTVSFHKRTELGICSRAKEYMIRNAAVNQREDSLTFPEHTSFGFDVMFEISSSQPDFDALSDVLYGIREDDFGVVVILLMVEIM